jgi:hypothetical protein
VAVGIEEAVAVVAVEKEEVKKQLPVTGYRFPVNKK